MTFDEILTKVRGIAPGVDATVKLKVDGDVGKALEFSKLIKK